MQENELKADILSEKTKNPQKIKEKRKFDWYI